MYRSLIADAGFILRENARHIGAAVGTSVHSAATHVLTEKMDGAPEPSMSDVEEVAIVSLRQEVAEGVTYDATRDNLNTSEMQSRRMSKSYALDVAPKIEPTAVEERLEATFGTLTISGQKDVLARVGKDLRDLKTGAVKRAHPGQYGAYALLESAHGNEVEKIVEDFIPRVRKTVPQPPPLEIESDRASCEAHAIATLQDIETSLQEFLKRLYGGGDAPEQAFRANPSSMLCGDKFCEAWGTKFCTVHQKGEQ
jgi:hypothetical protein